VLSRFDYPNKDYKVVGTPDPKIIGKPADMYDDGESQSAEFPVVK